MNASKLLLPILIALAVVAANAQAECPTITVTGPAGIPDEGALIPFYVQLQGNVPGRISYRWSVSTGKIVEGQGTDKAKFDVDWPTGVTVIATVEVIGLPHGCPNTASDKLAVSIDPGPIYVGNSGEPREYPKNVNELIEVLEKYPGSQGYIYIGTASSDRYQQIEQLVRATASQTGFDQSRLTINRETTSKELIELWVIRPGVNNPLCKACEDVACPRISLNGPAGYIARGMAITFSINADLPNLENLKYEWAVTAGKIDQGQGTPHLYLIIGNEDGGKELKVKVRVTGLPEGCPDTAEFVYGELQFEGDPESIDEWGRLSREDELGRLDLVAADWKQKPSHFLYFIVYLEQNETAASERARIRRISDHLTKTRRIPKEHVVFLKGGKTGHRRTVVYFVPPGAHPPHP